jgi:hypothetical protein
MIPGFNLDIRYKGKTFHVQTEDSGPGNPVIMTHLFIFGTILGSRKLDYADLVGQPDMVERVREHMRAELRAMHAALLAGEFDELAKRPMAKRKDLPVGGPAPTPAPMSLPTTPPEPAVARPAAIQERLSLPNVIPPAAAPMRAPRVTVEFPTDLVSEQRFDDVALAWLLEDVDET